MAKGRKVVYFVNVLKSGWIAQEVSLRGVIMSKKLNILYLLILSLLIILGACGKQETSQPVEPEPMEPVEEVEEEPEPEEVVYPYIAPLTGLGTMEEIKDRIIAVMINNHNQARPQSGLDKADMVVEILAEGWITRLVAFYQSEDAEVIGPVRSLRPYLIDLATGFDAVFAHAGGSPEALQIVRNRGLASLDEIYTAGPYFYRVNFRRAPHNLYTSLEKLREGAKARGFREESKIPTFTFKHPDELMSGEPANWIEIEYSSDYKVGYEYDPETMLYTRYVRGEPHIDMETEEPLRMSNVLVIETSHRVLDNEGRRAIDVTSKGKAYLFQRGKMQEVEWQNIDGVIKPVKDGQEIGWYPGKTWINVIPNSPGLENRVQYRLSKEE